MSAPASRPWNVSELSNSLANDGIIGSYDCPKCGAPLIPEHLSGLSLAWRCRTHGPVEVTVDPFAAND